MLKKFLRRNIKIFLNLINIDKVIKIKILTSNERKNFKLSCHNSKILILSQRRNNKKKK